MKLYALLKYETGEIIAIAEERDNVDKYIECKRFGKNEYIVTKIKKESAINKLLIDYDDLYLEHHKVLDKVLTRIELEMVDDVIGEEKARISDTLMDFRFMIENYAFNKKDKAILAKAYNIIEKSSKKKKIGKLIDLNNLVGYIVNSKNFGNAFRDKVSQASKNMYVLFKGKD